MASLVQSLDALQISDDEKRKDMYGYVYRTKKSRNYFHCSLDYIVVPSFDEKKMILCKLERARGLNCFVCFECEHVTALENMKLASKESSCIHVQLCSVLFSDMTCEKTHISTVEVLQNGSKCVSLVHPPPDKKRRLPGIVVLNSRTTKPKCHTCQGKKMHSCQFISGRGFKW